MAKLTVTPPTFVKTDPEGTVKKLCDYNIKLQEQLQFSLTAIEKRIETAIARMDKLNEKVEKLEQQTDSVIAAQNNLKSDMSQLIGRVSALETKVNNLGGA